MTSAAQVRKAAMALPAVEMTAHAGVVSFSVAGREFVRTTPAPAAMELRLPADDPVRDDVPAAEVVDDGGGTTVGVRIVLDEVNGMQVNAVVRRAWLARAPRSLAAKLEAGAGAGAGQVGDLPSSIGRPATRALAQEGLTTLQAVSERPATEVGALHGVGPKAIHVLREALAARGTSWD